MLLCMTDLLGLILSTILVLLIELIESALETLGWYFALYKCLCIIIIIIGELLKCIISNTTENNAKPRLQINVIIMISF